ncbi:MAG: DUF192 domain-containing protein [Planctomycetota bacterium]|jgi:uncharacterized membrane protein (UPF0127 family)
MLRLICLLSLLLAPPAAGPGSPPAPPAGPGDPVIEEVEIAGEVFRLELVADPAGRGRGLGGREELDEDGGMLFVFPRSRPRSFWMDACLIDIDIAFLDHRGRIVAVHEMKAEPARRRGESRAAYERRLRRYPSRRPAQFAIELAAGSLRRLDLEVGDEIELDRERLRKLAR